MPQDEKGYVSCPKCDDAVVHRLGQTNKFHCDSCGTTFTAEGYALFSERPP
jgi:ribosomal protein L37AE/L43A